MTNNGEKTVDFGYYCPRCKHYDKKSGEEPCEECLTYAVNLYSKKPVKFEADTKIVRGMKNDDR